MAASMEFSDSFSELFPMEVDVDCHSTASSPLPARVTGRYSPPRSKPFSVEESPVSAKRRRMNPERPKGRRAHPIPNRRSPRLSPTSLHRTSNDLTTLPFDALPKFSIEDLSQDKSVEPRALETLSDSVLAINRTFDSFSDTNLTISRTIDDLSDSQLSSPGRSPRDSPAPPFLLGNDVKVKGKYRKDELWAAIESDYQYLMDGEIIEQCKSTESDLSWESDDLLGNTKVSFTEFMQQYKELTDWLNHIQLVTQRQSSSLSEKYLNQTYHEEMLQRSPRRKLFNDYAKQLMRRYPNMKEEITVRIQHLNNQWQALEQAISPRMGYQDHDTMLKDLEADLNGLRKWLHEVESQVLPLHVKSNWTVEELERKLKEHQVLQQDIESHSKIVSAVLKLCEHLQADKKEPQGDKKEKESGCDSLQLIAVHLERRWHGIWLQSLEWQCRLEEAITRGKGLANTVLSSDSPWIGYNFSSRRNSFHPEITEENDDVISAGDSNGDDSEYGEEGLDLESNNSNSDIIPFSEGEYEKITVDTDCQTDGEHNNGRLSAGSSGSSSLDTGKSGKTSGCETDGIDSALGRSVSDDRVSVGTEAQPNVTHCSILLTSDSANKGASNKVVSFAPQAKDPEEDMKSRPEGDTMVSSRASSKKKSEAHDIGYSSESHSNDEPDDSAVATNDLNLADPNSNGKLPFTTSSPILPPKQLMSLDNVVLRKKALVPGQDTGSSSGNDADNTPSPTCADKSWRHSMTSAYDTSSNCSDFNNPLDLDITLETTVSCDTSVCTTIGEDPGLSSGAEAQEKVQSLEASPSRKFYSVAGVESDASSAYSTARKCLNTSLDGANTTDNELNNSKDVDFVDGDVASRFQHSTPVKDNDSDADGPRPTSLPGSASAKMLNLGDPWRQISKGKWPVFDRSESLSVQQDSEASSREAALNDDDFPECSEEEKQVPSASNESIKRLIQQAELLVRDTDLVNIPSNKSWVRRRKRASSKSSKCSSSSNNNNRDSLTLPPTIESGPSVPTTDFSANPTDRDSNVSSCDASSEGSSESEGEYSTASSDPDDQYTSAVHSLGTSRSGVLTSSTSSGSTLLRAYHPPKRTNRGERPWSVTELYELTNRLDLSPFSISESAIDDISKKNSAMQTSQSERLRRTTSDMSSQRHKRIDTARKHRKRKLKRSASDDHEQMRAIGEDLLLPGVASPPCFTQSCVEWRTSSHSYSSVDKSGASCSESQNVSASFYAERLPTASPLPERARHNTTDSELDVADRLFSSSVGVVPCESDSDNNLRSMNSTLESFSENAWDNYQDPPYQSISDDPNEEKLDDSALPWEQTLEFEEDFQLDASFGSGLRHKSVRSKRVSQGDASRADDTDSDLEDLHHVIQESRQQLQVTESALKKYRKDVMDTGIYIDPSKYAELIATCQTNIKCLDVISETLDSGENLANVTQDDLEQVHDIISRWEVLENLGRDRQIQSRDLAGIYADVLSIKSTIEDSTAALNHNCYEDVLDLEDTIKQIQSGKVELVQQRGKLVGIQGRIQEYAKSNPRVRMGKFKEELLNIETQLTSEQDRMSMRVSELQSALFSWYDFNETQKELAYLLKQERHQLECLCIATDLVTFSEKDLGDTIADLKSMEDDCGFYESKLQSMRVLAEELSPIGNEHAKLSFQASIALMANELSAIHSRCQDIKVAMEVQAAEHDSLDGAVGGQTPQKKAVTTAVSAAGVQATSAGVATSDAETQALLTELENATQGRRSAWIRLLKKAAPLQLVLVMALGLTYLIDPNNSDSLINLGLVFSPQLRYVRGPPPL